MEREKIETLVHVYNTSGAEFKQFRHCQAYVSAPIFCSAYNVTFRLIKSYETIVGLVDIGKNEFYELGKWSSTTSKQVTQIYNELFSDCTRYLLK